MNAEKHEEAIYEVENVAVEWFVDSGLERVFVANNHPFQPVGTTANIYSF